MVSFKEEWKDQMLPIMARQFPDSEYEEIDAFLDKKYDSSLKNENVAFDNGYTNEGYDIGMERFVNWSLGKKKPIMSGYGVAFKQHDDPTSTNLIAEMLKFLLGQRKVAKKEMFKAMQEMEKCKVAGNQDGADKWEQVMKAKDREQKILKLLANSYYGASGEKNSIFYDMDMGAAVTYTGVQIITTSVMAFESFLTNNIKPNNVSDALLFVERVLAEEYEYDFSSIIDADKVPDHQKVINYLANRIRERSPEDMDLIITAISALSDEQLSKIYYKNNFHEFLDNSCMQELLAGIVGVEFLNVEEVPEEIKENLETLWDVCREWVMYDYLYEDRYQRALNDERKAVLVVDTDSNFINVDHFYQYIKTYYDIDDNSNEDKLSVINIIIYILAEFVQMALNRLTGNLNISEEKQPIINMKNEFLYDRLMVTSNKKQYTGSLIAQEGNIIDPPKLDMKGMSIKKVNVNSRTRDYFTNIIKKDILAIGGDRDIDISNILTKFKDFEDIIRKDILEGNMNFSTPAKINEIDSYKNPYQMPAVRGVIAWNALFPDQMINPPDKVNNFKLIGEKLESLKSIYETDEFEIIRETIFDHEDLSKYGFTIISVPKGVDKLPDWMVPLVNVDEIVGDNIRTGIIVLESLGIKVMDILGSNYYSNVIEF